MELRCTYCQTMFSISRDEMLAGLEHMEEHKQSYYDAHCPNCRRANRVERARMERFFPDWKKTLRTMAKESSQAEATAEKTVATAPVKAADAPKPRPRGNAKKQPTGAKKK
jgi:predicted  nucleic acid-binding Zn-ribbon protein